MTRTTTIGEERDLTTYPAHVIPSVTFNPLQPNHSLQVSRWRMGTTTSFMAVSYAAELGALELALTDKKRDGNNINRLIWQRDIKMKSWGISIARVFLPLRQSLILKLCFVFIYCYFGFPPFHFFSYISHVRHWMQNILSFLYHRK